ncbi:ABC transporter ATP-binding protein [Cohnella lubricantis]|uniref:ABC transporter ATP-binding protein n=1 Tax=Cohnella lubricantis TaxID=2163172 RepID=A0A841TG05_9BACL|nr:ABC transporter ATP-binding protein [Cohnella lubricantis]MBB6678869.1 ABC transporter ATP-binding protein [Cohnella lubricantis]MBP2120195.1 iron complex transport system ATP-binding protein [Cohnella lubricantis]
MLRAERIGKSYEGVKVLEGIGFEVRYGETFGIIGPNGSGKSTLLKLLSGIEMQDSGEIRFDGRPIAAYSRKELARRMAVLEQEPLPPVGFTVREVIEMGRYPHQKGWFGDESADTAEGLIDGIMARLDLTEMAERSLEHLSGGEKQRVALAKVMAQQPELLMLDEPTTYLDIGRQIQLLDRIRDWQRTAKLTVVAVLHDLNLAALYCDRLLLLDRGRIIGIGSPEEILTPDLLTGVYGTRPLVVPHPASGLPQVMLQPGSWLERGGGMSG